MANPKIEVEIGAKIGGLLTSLTDAESRLQSFGRNAVAFGAVMSAAVTAPLLLLGKSAIKSASDTEEAFSKFNTVFRDVAKSAEDSFKTLRNEYGLSSLEAKSLLAGTGDLLTGFGFTQKSALELATEVNKLAVDLASFTNFAGGADGASKALTSALLGEREAVKALGISILEEDVKKKVAINTAQGLTFETERQAKAYATLQIAQEQSKNSLGDYARTSESFANQTRLLTSRFSDLSSELGEVLLPLATKITSGITGIINGFTGLSDSTKTTIIVLGGLLAAIGPLSLAIGGIITALPLLAAGFAALTGPIGIIGIAVVGLTALIVTNFDQVKYQFKITLLEIITFSQTVIKALDLVSGAVPGFKAITTGALLSLESLGRSVAESLVNDFGVEAVKGLEEFKNQTTETVTAVSKGLGLIGGLTSQIATLNEQRDLAKDQTEVNLITAKVTALQDQLALINAIAKRAADPVKSEVGVLAPRDNPFEGGLPSPVITQGVQTDPTAQMLEAAERGKEVLANTFAEMREYASQFSDDVGSLITSGVSNAFADLGQSLGEAISEGANVFQAVGKSILRSLGGFLGELGYMMIQYGTMAIVKAKLDASLLVPGAGFVTGPLAIAAGVALVALSSAIGAKASGGGGGGGGGGSVGSGVSGQSFTGGGVGGLGGVSRELMGELVVRGNDLVYVLGQSKDKITKG